jgi:thymidylate synthase (FAD)
MKIVNQVVDLLYPETDVEWERELKLIEVAGRTAYKSEGKITENSALPFIKNIISRNHLAVIEFGNMIVRFTTDRGISHEIVRHRLCSFVQESTRYCDYSQEKFGHDITFIAPHGVENGDTKDVDWQGACLTAEERYFSMLSRGFSPQIARSVLPNCTKTEIVVKANFREWRHIFMLRAIQRTAHPDMRNLMIPLYEVCRSLCPVIFDMGEPENGGAQ